MRKDSILSDHLDLASFVCVRIVSFAILIDVQIGKVGRSFAIDKLLVTNELAVFTSLAIFIDPDVIVAWLEVFKVANEANFVSIRLFGINPAFGVIVVKGMEIDNTMEY